MQSGVLHVIATPIGNLDDLSPRARTLLAESDAVAAEDTRHSGKLLAHLGLKRPMIALHEHNEAGVAQQVLDRVAAGERIALICDAGTPTISDPGYRLLSLAREAGIRVEPVPGPCAAITALSVAGLPTDRFLFVGFLPAKTAARRTALAEVAGETGTLVFYESTHRVAESLTDMVEVLGGERRATLARELTKLYEDVRHGSLSTLAELADSDPVLSKGELVVVVEGAAEAGASAGELDRVLRVLLPRMSVKDAVAAAVEITGERKNTVYARAQELSDG